ncbi:pyrimidine utilization flavin reductase protein F [Verticiella sediminum]|uniref:FMN reductase (NADH) RutF n=1 Tax=Verticiella sediminum TaxID=1247510 RepID=A0A556AKH2_9BURK|nr:pyrimidine utilization flavin reductase protein F [Verticiella sediminum]TSH93394.1 pyrimidine utilization flavin reductase protein F [Verticiella sediminum]
MRLDDPESLPWRGDLPPREEYRNAMARLGAAVSIITTDGPAGRAGFTASAVCSVTDEPPTLLVCLNRSASVYAAFKENGVLCVNALAAGQQALSSLFGGKTPMAERFAAANWGSRLTGSPVLAGAAVSFDCRVADVARVGTHDVLFCEVRAVATGSTPHGLIYFERRYHDIMAPSC